MVTSRHYLDHNATAPLRPEAREAVLEALACVGNPSSIHAEGRTARARVERARGQVAALLGADPAEVVFTSGGTEGNNALLRPGALLTSDGHAPERLLLGATEHASVLGGHSFGSAESVAVRSNGVLDLDDLRAKLAGVGPALVSVQVANSETGVVQPVAAIAAVVRDSGGCLHVDAVQACGRIAVDVAAIDVDALTLSGHKLGAPQGTGAVFVRRSRAGAALPFLRGGPQEGRRRGGTENVAGLTGLGAAAAAAARDLDDERVRLAALRDAAERSVRLAAPDAIVFGEGADRLPNTLSFAVPGLPAATCLMALDLAGVAVSSGSACASGTVARSHVLAAMGVDPDLAAGAVRVSFGWSSDDADVAAFAAAFEGVVHRLYDRRTRKAA